MEEVVSLKTNNFNKIVIDLVYSSKREDNYAIYGNLLVRMLTKKTKEFSSEENFSNALIRNYVLDFSLSKQTCGDNWFYVYHITIPDWEVLKDKEYSYQHTLEFLKKAIYEPYALNDDFYEEELDKAKITLKTQIESGLKKITGYSSIRMDKIIDDLGYFNDSLYNHIDDIKNITSRDLYKYYKSVINNRNPFIFVVGNVTNEFNNLLLKTFNSKEDCKYLPYEVKPYGINKEVKVVEESKEYSQSIVKMAYKVRDYKKEDMVMLALISIILNSQSSNVLGEVLRNQNNLVYTSGAFAYLNNGVLIITAQIYRKNKDKTIEVIKEVMDYFKQQEFLEEKLSNVSDRMRINLERQKDTIYANLDDLQVKYFESYLPLPEEYEVIKKIKTKDIVKFRERLVLDTIYYLEGSIDAE